MKDKGSSGSTVSRSSSRRTTSTGGGDGSSSINHGHNTNTSSAPNTRGRGGGGGGINSFHGRVVVGIESANSCSGLPTSVSGVSPDRGRSTSSTNTIPIDENDARLPPAAQGNKAHHQGATAQTVVSEVTSSRTTYNSVRSGSSSVGHSPKKTVRMTTAVTNSSNQSLQQQQQLQDQQKQQHQQQHTNTKPATSNHSSISSLLSALSGAAGSSFCSSGFSITGASKSGFPAASFSFISNTLSSSSSSAKETSSFLSTSSVAGRTRASSLSFASSGEAPGVKNPTEKVNSRSNHIPLNSKVEKVLSSIQGLNLGQDQSTGVPPSTPSPTATTAWGQKNSTGCIPPLSKGQPPEGKSTTVATAVATATTTTSKATSTPPCNNSVTNASKLDSVGTSPVVPRVQVQASAPVPDSTSTTTTSGGGQGTNSKPLAVSQDPGQQRKHSATFSSFELSDAPKRPLKLKNHSVHTLELYDTLHFKSSSAPQSNQCTDHVCLGSIVSFPTTKSTSVSCRPVEEVKRLAKDFFDQYYTSIKRYNSTSHVQRWEQVLAEIEDTNTYNLTETELVYGAKLAWRNSVRCIGRIQWAKLQCFDARSVTTTTGMFEAVCKHIKYATNKGNIRSAITIFPQRTDGKHDFRIWNPQLLSYAGYKKADGSVIGDPLNVEFTEVCTKLGWKGKGTKWDKLPLVLSADGHDPEYFEIPSELILEISIIHPHYDWFAEMDMRWYALPAVSSMLFDCGGLEFTACPFNGWYMGTEIGCRDLGDIHRYNVLEEVATRLGLDTKNPTTLWKDRALVELNLAVLHSYQKAGVTVVDHHTASESFMKHYENEMRMRGGCPADWVWIVPPMSGSATPVFHQEMAMYLLKPNYEYQDPAWRTHVWKKGSSQRDGGPALGLARNRKGARRKFHFKEIARAVKFTSKLFGKALSKRVKATILYATETGKSEMYARRLEEIFGHAFNAQVCRMDEYDVINIEHETLILVVTSTFGNGDPPENGESFAHSLFAIKMNQGPMSLGADELSMASSKSFIKMNSQTDSVIAERRFDRNDSLKGSQISDIMSDDNLGPLRNITFAVFGLGSSAYPNFCAFGRYVDNLLGELGGERLTRLTCGDELAGQDQAFRTWAAEIFQTACDSFCLDFDKNMAEISAALKADTLSPDTVRFLPVETGDEEVQALSKLHNRKFEMYNLVEKTNLHENESSRVTIKVVLRKRLSSEAALAYQSGDHVGVVAENRAELVNAILNRLANKPTADDEPVQVQLLQEKHTPMGVQKQWIPNERLPQASLRQMLTRYLDITTPPQPNLLLYLTRCTEDTEEQERLDQLAKDPDVYEHWKQFHWPNLVTVLEQFPKVKPDATVLCNMLPLLQPRFYSVSSSPTAYAEELHLTVAVVTYRTKGGEGPTHYGVCSNYLNDIKIGSLVPCFVRSAVSFHMPTDMSRPMIMVGPGTGIAPFRGFWQERKIIAGKKASTKFGRMTLFFGCRTKEMILYRSELEGLKKDNILSDIFLALSREPSVKKTYVQDLLRREGDSVAHQIMQEGGHVYVCGDCTMAEDVYQTLKSIVQDRGKLNDFEVENYMLSLRDDNRYHEDIFGITHRTAEVHEKVRQTAMTRIESNYSLSNASIGK